MGEVFWSGFFFLGATLIYLPLRPFLHRTTEFRIGRPLSEETHKRGDQVLITAMGGLGIVLVVAGLLGR